MITEQIMLDTDEDDIFARPPRAVARAMAQQTAQITCRVCDQLAKVPLGSDGLICDACRRAPATMRQRVAGWLAGIDAQERDAHAAFGEMQQAHPTHWQKIVDARASGRPDCDARARSAHPTYAALLDAEAACLAAIVPLQAERERLERALEELDSLGEK